MPSLNKVHLIGNLTRDPEFKTTNSGTSVAQIGLAINQTFSKNGEKKEETTFVDITLWGKLADLANQYLKKGNPVFIEGRLRNESWVDKETGKKRSKMTVVGDSIQFLSSKNSSSKEADPNVGYEDSGSNDDDIPF